MVGLHPTGGKIWLPTGGAGTVRADNLATCATATTTNRLGVYNPTTRVFTQNTVAGAWCNAKSSTTQAVIGGVVVVGIAPGFLLCGVAADIAIGQEVMADGTGQLTPFVAGGGRVALGWSPSNIPAGSSASFTAYDY